MTTKHRTRAPEADAVDGRRARSGGPTGRVDVPEAARPVATVRTTGIRRRLFAAIWKAMDASVDSQVAEPKDEVLRDVAGHVVEIGSGRGSNFPRYPAGVSLKVLEPNRHMHAALAERAAACGLDAELIAADLRDAHLPSDSVDVVVSTLTLCSVPDRAAAVAEIRRVLRPGGRFLFIEHVAEPAGPRRVIQRLVRFPWRWAFDDCDPCADTDQVIAQAGFASVDSTTRNLEPALDPTNRVHWGVATK